MMEKEQIDLRSRYEGAGTREFVVDPDRNI
jgi:hypothetical protein